MKIFIGCDHAALELKNEIRDYVMSKGFEVDDKGIYEQVSVNYPDIAYAVCSGVVSEEGSLGILVCGTGIGMSMAANKVKGIRAAAVSEPFSARLTRQHNNANVLCIGARVVGSGLAKLIVDEFLGAEFEGGRHADRVNLITKIENGEM